MRPTYSRKKTPLKNLGEEKFEGKKPTEKHPRSYILVDVLLVLVIIVPDFPVPVASYIGQSLTG